MLGGFLVGNYNDLILLKTQRTRRPRSRETSEYEMIGNWSNIPHRPRHTSTTPTIIMRGKISSCFFARNSNHLCHVVVATFFSIATSSFSVVATDAIIISSFVAISFCSATTFSTLCNNWSICFVSELISVVILYQIMFYWKSLIRFPEGLAKEFLFVML